MTALQSAVVPGYYLVCYNLPAGPIRSPEAVVPGYYLVCYNKGFLPDITKDAVVPGYYLVCYNKDKGRERKYML